MPRKKNIPLDQITSAGSSIFKGIRPLPWVGMGTILTGITTIKEALIEAGQDYQVLKVPVLFNCGTEEDPSYKTIPGQFTTYRSDTQEPLGVVGSRYTVAQNDTGLAFFDEIIEQYGAVLEMAGVLDNGSTTYLVARMPARHFVPGDEIIPYMLLLNAHDGSNTRQVLFTPVRVVCNNTLMMALGKVSNRIKIGHTTNLGQQTLEAGRVMALYNEFCEEMSNAMTYMSKVRVSEKQVEAYIRTLFTSLTEQQGKDTSVRSANIRQTVKVYLYGNDGGQQMFPGTAYQAYQGITGFFQNVRFYRTEDGIVSQQLFGDDAKSMVQAFQLAMDMTS